MGINSGLKGLRIFSAAYLITNPSPETEISTNKLFYFFSLSQFKISGLLLGIFLSGNFC
jgi:hypothetical protein